MEVEVEKSRKPLSDRVMGSSNGAARVIGFIDFREEVEGGGAGIGDIEERDVLQGETMEGASVLKESEEGLVVDFGRVVREKAVSSSIRQLTVHLSKIVILVEGHSGTALVCQEDQNVGIGPEGTECLVLKRG